MLLYMLEKTATCTQKQASPVIAIARYSLNLANSSGTILDGGLPAKLQRCGQQTGTLVPQYHLGKNRATYQTLQIQQEPLTTTATAISVAEE